MFAHVWSAKLGQKRSFPRRGRNPKPTSIMKNPRIYPVSPPPPLSSTANMKNQPDDPLLVRTNHNSFPRPRFNLTVHRDLNRVLRHGFQFSGSFALPMVVPSPGLDVDGAGCIVLPLTDHTANLVASVGEQSPRGSSMWTILDTTVGDTV